MPIVGLAIDICFQTGPRLVFDLVCGSSSFRFTRGFVSLFRPALLPVLLSSLLLSDFFSPNLSGSFQILVCVVSDLRSCLNFC